MPVCVRIRTGRHLAHRKGNLNNAEEGHNSLCPYKIQKHKEEKFITISRRGTMHRAHRKKNNNAEEGHNSLCPYKDLLNPYNK